MSDPVTRKTSNYDPNNFKVPEFRKNKDGKLDPTDYQAAVALKDFMQRNDMLFFNEDQLKEGNEKGTVANGDRAIQLNDKEKAMFKKLSDGLFNRLDAGDNDTHDGVVGGRDIDKSIKTSWKLHGDKTSEEGYWKDPTASLSMTPHQAKEHLLKYMDENKDNHLVPYYSSKDNKVISREILENAINFHKFETRFKDGIDDPEVIQALILLRKDFDKVNIGDSENLNSGGDEFFLTLEEIKKWKV
ncbi:hypothetical protein RY831_11505 [Noviherbaspirillum sp. CPCC 100848]|uniref:EF-hand domain-containing protein n=1 Tax=Noviherbaspirillum album TaxID=3080276 RepID=A0ABU6J806_9BURK|nr:hypothetical protein [Noviherbaspirillum sp. CPCC 100848]MEC4719777.1 hypothetical protein [Noviherbaspirillum sp. CPCC 100848]